MRNLIKKILFEEFHKPRTYIEEVSLSDLHLILEKIECTESDATVEVDNYKKMEVEAYITEMYNYDSFYYDQKSKRSFFIKKPTRHWLQRLDRKKEEHYVNDPKYFDPTPTEGIELIFKLKDQIIQRLINHPFEKTKQLCLKLIDLNAKDEYGQTYDEKSKGYTEFVEATKKTNVEYTNLIKIDKVSHYCNYIGKQCYGITLITQLKGPEFDSKKYPECKQKVF